MRKITCLLLLLCLLPSFALADKTITLTFTGDITLGGCLLYTSDAADE